MNCRFALVPGSVVPKVNRLTCIFWLSFSIFRVLPAGPEVYDRHHSWRLHCSDLHLDLHPHPDLPWQSQARSFEEREGRNTANVTAAVAAPGMPEGTWTSLAVQLDQSGWAGDFGIL